MDIKYYSNNNKCFNLNQGSIIIESIDLNTSELSLFGNYIIQWSGVPNNSNGIISSDGRSVSNLPNGTYAFRLINPDTSYFSSFNTISISSPPELSIITVKHSEYSCNDNGSIYMEISGGKPPYTYLANNYSLTTEHTSVNITGLPPGVYNTLFVRDSNSCSATSSLNITIKDSRIFSKINYVSPPQVLDDYGVLNLSVTGYGPFDFIFNRLDTEEKTYVAYFITEYLKLFDHNTNTYTYHFNNLLSPGEYEIIITSINGCSTTLPSITIPNINPITVSIKIKEDSEQTFINYVNTLPIFDTLLIPYQFIENNTSLWNFIKTKNLSDDIDFLINGELYTFTLIRNIGDKNYIHNNEIEILQLGEDSQYWFFVLQLAPGINMNVNPEFLDAKIQIKGDDQNFDILLGLNNEIQIDNLNPSLIIGSLIIDGLGYNQFYNGANVCVSITEPETTDDCNFTIQNTKKTINKDTYNVGFVTIINFLQDFNHLNKTIQIGSTTNNFTQEQYSYRIKIKQLLQNINNPNSFNNIFVFNKNSIIHNGAIYIDINGNPTIENNRIQQQNDYSIKYFYLDSEQEDLINLYIGSELLENISSINNLKNGLYLIRIKDMYNNIPKFLYINGMIVNYDDHCIESKKIIQEFNNSLLSKFVYGDILVYVGSTQQNLIDNIAVPSIEIQNTDNLPSTIIPLTPIITQIYNSDNTGAINISFMNFNIKCYLNGPQNYRAEFNKPTIFNNLIPGIYTIFADENDLIKNSLYQNEIRVIVEKDNTYDLILDFTSYENQIILKDSNNNVY